MDNWKIVITFTYPHEAHMVEGFLNSHGIETFLKDEMTVQSILHIQMLSEASKY